MYVVIYFVNQEKVYHPIKLGNGQSLNVVNRILNLADKKLYSKLET